MARVTQKERVKKYLDDFGSITVRQAMEDIGVGDVRSVLRDLRKDGIAIKREDKKGTNRYGDKVTFGVWSYDIKEEK